MKHSNIAASIQANPAANSDRRNYRRIPLKLQGRILDEKSEEHAILTEDISCGGASLIAKVRPAVGTRLICYIDHIARVSGEVVRHTAHGFAVRFDVSDHKREKLVDKLTWVLNAERLGLSDERQEERFPATGPTIVVRQDGRRMPCRVADISLTGASFECDGPPPPLNEIVHAGSLKGEVVRRDRRFFAIRFLRAETEEERSMRELSERRRSAMRAQM